MSIPCIQNNIKEQLAIENLSDDILKEIHKKYQEKSHRNITDKQDVTLDDFKPSFWQKIKNLFSGKKLWTEKVKKTIKSQQKSI